MKHIFDNAPNVADAFFNMTAEIRKYTALDQKTGELVIIGVMAANRSSVGLRTHITRAMEAGCTKDEILSAIIMGMPIVGVATTNMALNTAVEVINETEAAKTEEVTHA